MPRAFSRVKMSDSAALGDQRIGAAQRVVGAEFEDYALGSLGNRPVEPVAAAGGGIAGHPGIADIDVYPPVLQCLLKLRRKRIGRRQAKPRGQGIAEHHEPHRLALACERSTGESHVEQGQAQHQHKDVREAREPPLDPGCESAI